MKTKAADKDLTLIQLFDRFGTDEAAREHLESKIWPNGIVCPHCQCKDQARFSKINPNPKAKTRVGLRWCSDCKKPFTCTINTIFEDSHIPLRKWLIAYYLICSSKKGISSLQLQRILELGSYRSALFMAHRIRHTLLQTSFADKLGGTVEADECHVPVGANEPDAKRATRHARVFSMVERGANGCWKAFDLQNGVSESNPFNEGRTLSGRVRDKNENFTFELWGFRPATPDELQQAYDFWFLHEGRRMKRKNRRVQIAWNQ